MPGRRFPLLRPAFWLVLIFAALPVRLKAFTTWVPWNFGRDIEMHLQLENPSVTFQDGSLSWNAIADDALGVWNQQINAVRFVPAPPAGTPSFGDLVSSVFFSNKIFEQDFGANTIAVTIWYYVEDGGRLLESDVIFNNTLRFDSYRGPLQKDSDGRIFDFKRVALHEFGHALGLRHPDEYSQSVVALMNSTISHLDHITADDIAGARSLYWNDLIGTNTTAVVLSGHSFSFQLTSPNSPISFSATGLPLGLTLNKNTGLLSGLPLMSGTYDVTLSAYGSQTLSGLLHIVIPKPRIVSSLQPSGFINEPFHYQILSDHQAISYDADVLPAGLALDRATGVIFGVPITVNGLYATQVTVRGTYEDAVASVFWNIGLRIPPSDPALFGLPVRSPTTLVADPHRPRIYCGTIDNGVVVIDTDSLTILKSFPSGTAIDLTISPDGRTLWVVHTSVPHLARLDLDALDEVVALPVTESLLKVFAGPENRLYCGNPAGEVLQIDGNSGAIQWRFRPPSDLRGGGGGPAAISPDRKTLYVSDAGLIGDTLLSRGALSRYDVSGPIPILLQRFVLPDPGLTDVSVSPAGDAVFVGLRSSDGFGGPFQHTTLILSAQDLSVTKGELDYLGTSASVTFSADGKLAILPVYQGSGGDRTATIVYLYDLASLQLTQRIVVGASSHSEESIFLGGVVSDESDKYLFVATSTREERPLLVYPLMKTDLPPPPPVAPPKRLLNVSTRLRTQTNENVLIGGFIISGEQPKRVIIRALGPSLPMNGKLLDPTLELHGPEGELIAKNDNWQTIQAPEIFDSGLRPGDQFEAAILTTLLPGAYTAVVRGNANTTGVALVEVYDLTPAGNSRIVNISTRGRVETGDNVMIGGFILSSDQPTKVIVRAIGPSLGGNGVSGALNDTTLDLHDGNGALIASNDDWQSDQAQEILDTTVAPTDPRESAIVRSLQPGNYTAIVRGKNERSGVALVEVFNLDN